MRILNRFFVGIVALLSAMAGFAQPKLEFNLKKPQQFEERQLPSEKLAEKKFTFLRRFFQNNYTHYNYYFNANQRLNEIVEESKLSYQDDYTKLLSYYPYTLDQTSRSSFLDSVLQKCTAGILLHDLRNDWIDDMYLLMGKAYLLRKNFDSAAMTFQYINYSYAPKEKDGFDKPIGSNQNADDGGNALSVSTKEKKGTFSYLVTEPPSRNDAFVWQVRTLTENGNYIDASSLIETLRNDPVFPQRLKEELADARGYLYYKLEMWDSAAKYLIKAIPTVENRHEKARSYYLAGQMYAMANDYKAASEAFDRCTELALDPVMEVYARLNTIRLNKGNDPKIIDQNIASLLSMAKKDRYSNYRDIIYYAAALFEMERNGYDNARNYLKKSIQSNNNNAIQRSKSFMLLANIDYAQKKYGPSAPLYDSVDATIMPNESVVLLDQRKPGTHHIYEADQVIYLQDSLLHLSDMDENERTSYVKQLAKKLRKERGLQEEPVTALGANPNVPLTGGPSSAGGNSPNLFTSTSGAWYFYDVNIRANGFTKFKQRWGGRPNEDNWRRSAALLKSSVANNQVINRDIDSPMGTDSTALREEVYDSTDITFDNLYSRIPVSQESRDRANARINQALYKQGVALHEELEDYDEAIKVFEKLLSRQDSGDIAEKSLFALVHCYTQVGDIANANRCKQLLQQKFSGTASSEKLDKSRIAAEEAATNVATQTYKRVYDLFIDGSFEEAIREKNRADSTIGTNYWTPQLLYIESVYHIKQRDDSAAIQALQNIQTKFADNPLAERSKIMIDVLRRRKEIEEYLTNLEITRAKEEEIVITRDPVRIRPANIPPKDSVLQPQTVVSKPVVDTIPKLITSTPTQVSPYIINPADPTMVAIVLEKVDPAYVNEVLYSFNSSSRKNWNGNPVEASKLKLRDNLWVVLLKSPALQSAANAVDYINYLKPVAQKEIISWLDVSRYHYILLNDTNLDLLQQDPNMELYEKILRQTFPGQF